MNRFLLALLLPLFLAVCARGQSVEDQYIRIYALIQEGDSLAATNPAQARVRYTEAQGSLQRFQRVFPDWNPNIVAFRLKYLAGKLAAAPGPTPVTRAATAPGASAPAASARPAGISPELGALQEQVRQLQTDKLQLEGKLREALAARPAVSDPRELARAQERIKGLQKENELLQVSLTQAKSRTTVAAPAPAAAPSTPERSQLAAAQGTDALTIALLRKENEVLQGLLAKAGEKNAALESAALQQSREQTAALQRERDQLRLEKLALENRIESLAKAAAKARTQAVASATAPTPAPPSKADARTEDRIRQLETDKQKLERELGQARRDLAARSSRSSKPEVRELQTELTGARAKLLVYESKAVPFTPEELALFRGSPPALSTNNTAPVRSRDLPAGTTQLLAEARRHFAAREMDKAESKYLEVLKKDDRNTFTLANLAVIQLEMNRLEEAEKHARKALAENPNDPFSLLVLGQIQFRQKKFDDSVQALSRAAQLEPENPDVQNHLGVALGEKGMRVAAEAALRKAVQLRPGYATAHHNLAVVYISAKPPSAELAKWHYQKAMAAGAPRDPALERLMGLSLPGRVE